MGREIRGSAVGAAYGCRSMETAQLVLAWLVALGILGLSALLFIVGQRL